MPFPSLAVQRHEVSVKPLRPKLRSNRILTCVLNRFGRELCPFEGDHRVELAPHFEWFQWSNPVTIWWVFLVVVSSLNMLFWSWTRLYFRNLKSPVVLLSAFYVFGCAFRSFLPRADVQRIVLFDTWWSSVFVGRTVATIAELAFVAQWAIVLKAVAASLAQNEARHSSTSRTTAWVTKVASFIVPMIVFAEVCSWYAVITTNYIGNSIEEST